MILFHNTFEQKVHSIFRDDSGNFIILDVSVSEKKEQRSHVSMVPMMITKIFLKKNK